MASIRDGENELSLLGSKTTQYSQDYAPEVLEAFTNKHQGNDYWVRFHCPEFTSLCPITAQPDYATIYINYIPDVRMVESKSLKLYLFSFRNHGAFHEDCVNIIMKSPTTSMYRGSISSMRSFMMIFTQSSWKAP